MSDEVSDEMPLSGAREPRLGLLSTTRLPIEVRLERPTIDTSDGLLVMYSVCFIYLFIF